jgi:hypothetical protein
MRLMLRRRVVAEPTLHAKPAKADEQYAGAFARVRLVRAWIGAAAAMVALGYAFNTLLDRLLP